MSRRTFNLTYNSLVEEPMVNLTPLIDVVFVILIAFIVIAPLLELDQIELADAGSALKEKAHLAQEASSIVIHVRKDDIILLNGAEVELSDLVSRLKAAKVKYPQARPQLFQDKKAHFGTYQSVKNAAEAAGFAQLDLILKPS